MTAGLARELQRLDLLLHREILRLRARYQLSLDELRGVYISDERVDDLLAANRADGAPDILELTRAADDLAATLESPLTRIAKQLDLTAFERDAILVALAPELDLKYEALYGYLNNLASRRRATIDLVLRVCGRSPEHGALLAASSRLLRDGMLEIQGDGARSELATELVVGPSLIATILDRTAFDARLAPFVEPVRTRHAANVVVGDSLDRQLAQLATMLAPIAQPPILVLVADPGHAPEAAAAAFARHAQRDLLRATGGAWPTDPHTTTSLALMATLSHSAVVLDLDEWTNDRRTLLRIVGELLRLRVPAIAITAPTTDWRAILREHAVIPVRLDDPDIVERSELWRRALANHAAMDVAPSAVSKVAEFFRLGPAQIDDAARALAFTSGPDDRDRLFQVARAQSSNDLGQLAQLVPARHSWEHLVLPGAVLQRLRNVAAAVTARAKVFREWGFGKRGGSGLMALFAGTSGTGKTLSASVIARDIGLDLYRIELASVVSKYIGETEKNLARIFDGARRANVILFFDEADALLGRRSEVKDAHDRYANIEVAYLLQKMEEHDGVVILASNLAKNMDQAFARRMHYVVEFPRPDAPLRERLWQTILPRELPLAADVDLAFLARQFDLAGGDIKTITLDAAFAAAAANRPLAMSDLIDAVSRQMIKQGRPPSASDFKHHYRAGGGRP